MPLLFCLDCTPGCELIIGTLACAMFGLIGFATARASGYHPVSGLAVGLLSGPGVLLMGPRAGSADALRRDSATPERREADDQDRIAW